MRSLRVERLMRELETYPQPQWIPALVHLIRSDSLGSRAIRSSVAVIVIGVVAAAFAGEAKAEQRIGALIASAPADPVGATLVLEGRGFLDGRAEPVVHLNGFAAPLRLVRASERSVTVALPAGLAWGSYVLRISRRGEQATFEERPFDWGIVGPSVQDD